MINKKLFLPIPADLKWKNETPIIKGEFIKLNNKVRQLIGYSSYILIINVTNIFNHIIETKYRAKEVFKT